MIQTLNKHVKWRADKRDILVCNCKLLSDCKLPLKYISFMRELSCGMDKEKLNLEDKKAFSDFEKMKFLSNLEIRQISVKEFEDAMKLLDKELGKTRVRGRDFLKEKFKEYPYFFIGLFLEKEIIGIACGFPREDYLLLSELAVDSRFHKRGFGKKLVEEFEKVGKSKSYKKIHAGAEDSAIGFYLKLSYKPFLIVQFKQGSYSPKDFAHFKIMRQYISNGHDVLECETKNTNQNILDELRNKFDKASFQYIFVKEM